MKTSLLFVLITFCGIFAHAKADSNGKYRMGVELCRNTSAKMADRKSCEDWVLANANDNFFEVALGVCGTFTQKSATKKVACFLRARQWLSDEIPPNLSWKVTECFDQSQENERRAECLNTLFEKTNEKFAKDQAFKLPKNSAESSSTSKFQ